MTPMEIGLGVTSLLTVLMPWTESKTLSVHVGFFLMLLGAYLSPSLGRTPLDVPIACYCGCVVIASWLSRSPRFALFPRPRRGDGVLTTLSYGAAALVAARLPSAHVTWFLWGLILVGTIQAILALSQAQNLKWARRVGGAKDTTDGAWGTQGNPTMLGGYLLMLLPLSLSLGGFGYFAAIVIATAIFCTGSRAAILGLVMASGLILWRLPWLSILPVGLGVSLGPFWSHRLFERTSLTPVAVDRGYMWGWAIRKILHRPLFGYGANMFVMPVPDTRPEIHDSTHNEILEIAHVAGLVGLTCYLWIWRVAFLDGLTPITMGLIAYSVWLMFTWSAIGVANIQWLLFGLALHA